MLDFNHKKNFKNKILKKILFRSSFLLNPLDQPGTSASPQVGLGDKQIQRIFYSVEEICIHYYFTHKHT